MILYLLSLAIALGAPAAPEAEGAALVAPPAEASVPGIPNDVRDEADLKILLKRMDRRRWGSLTRRVKRWVRKAGSSKVAAKFRKARAARAAARAARRVRDAVMRMRAKMRRGRRGRRRMTG